VEEIGIASEACFSFGVAVAVDVAVDVAVGSPLAKHRETDGLSGKRSGRCLSAASFARFPLRSSVSRGPRRGAWPGAPFLWVLSFGVQKKESRPPGRIPASPHEGHNALRLTKEEQTLKALPASKVTPLHITVLAKSEVSILRHIDSNNCRNQIFPGSRL
jgi:hypothetical protein